MPFPLSSHVSRVPVAHSGADYPGLRIRPEVEVGDLVAQGQLLFRDARHAEVCFTAAISGRVTALRHGTRRTLSEFVIVPDDDAPGPVVHVDAPTKDVRGRILESGLWPAFVTRPFGGHPEPDVRPQAIVVSAVPSSEYAPEPGLAVAGREADLARGLTALTALTEGPVHLCHAADASFEIPTLDRVVEVRQRLSPTWRTAGGQLAALRLPAIGREVWTVLCQDVLEIGRLLETGTWSPIRTVALRTMERGAEPRFVDVPLGADLRALLAESNGFDSAARAISGPTRNGRPAAYLGRHHLEAGVDVWPTSRAVENGPRPLLPLTGLNRVLPRGVPAVPLMRALSIGDPALCVHLGCLGLLEEDVVPLTRMCSSGTDYAASLRSVLDNLRKDAA